mgnify:CR=1 FL=1
MRLDGGAVGDTAVAKRFERTVEQLLRDAIRIGVQEPDPLRLRCFDLSKLAEQQETLRASMVARFAQADSRVAASKSTLSFLQSQIDVWNAQGN